MEIAVVLAWLLLGILCGFILLFQWNAMRYKRKGLPPGTMGWPIFGETMKFIQKGPEFINKQRIRYGEVFKTYILGFPTIISMDQELNRYIFLNEAKGFLLGYPRSVLDILGKHNIGATVGTAHKQIRGSVLQLIGPPAIKDKWFLKLDKYMNLYLDGFEDGKIIDIQELTKDMAFSMSLKLIMDQECSDEYKFIRSEFDKLVAGTLSLPFNIYGTDYHRGLQARKNVIKILTRIMKTRSASSIVHDDMLNHLLNDDGRYKLNHEEILDQIIMILHSGYETVSTTTMMTIKYLHDNPEALQELADEHFMILRNKSKDQTIDWNDYKMMRFTRAIIYETMRLATVVNGVLRKTTKDVELNGFLIPKGWRIYMFTRGINYDPNLYREPLKFNPWRWLENDGLENHDYCFLFGGGTRLCPGKEIGMATISLFLRYFVTRYRWESTGDWKIHEFPRVEAPYGLKARVFKNL